MVAARNARPYSRLIRSWHLSSCGKHRGAHTMRKRVLGIVAHIDAGKTTTSERMLYYAGALPRMGNVDSGDTTLDFLPAERERGITVNSAAISFNWRDHELFLVDSPGHLDFTYEVQRALRVMDGVVVIVDAVSGVQPQTETVWRQADQYMLPRIVYINKMDRAGADFTKAVESVERRVTAKVVKIHFPVVDDQSGEWIGFIDLITMEAVRRTTSNSSDYKPDRNESRFPLSDKLQFPGCNTKTVLQAALQAREHLVETLADIDDGVMDAWACGRTLDSAQLKEAIRKASLCQRIIPVLCGSSLKNVGVQALLDAVIHYLPSPLERPLVVGKTVMDEEVQVSIEPDGPLLAVAFKVTHDHHRGQLVFMRAFRGGLHGKVPLFNESRRKKEVPTSLLRIMADQAVVVEKVATGDIFAAVGLVRGYPLYLLLSYLSSRHGDCG
jgi:elongation factor G